MKKKYDAPILVLYGDLKKVTQGGAEKNSDCPCGDDNTSYPPKDKCFS